MNKKTIFIGLGVLAVAGIGYYMWKKNQPTTTSKFSGACGCSGADGCEEKSNAQAGGNKCDCFNGILEDSFGNTVKDSDGKNVTCSCGSAAYDANGNPRGGRRTMIKNVASSADGKDNN